ncbi:MAG: sodium:dicarboxylate symporter family protein [Francisellaceae bacterium]|nr:sodium:dicarboxylate symporter family protein [Francisellaceae bacterium]
MFKWKLPKINLSIKLILIFVFAIFFGHLLPVEVKSLFFSISIVLKECLLWVLPIIIFGCLYKSILEQGGKAVKFVGVMLLLVTISNYVSTLFAYGASSLGMSKLMANLSQETKLVTKPLEALPLFENFSLTPLIKNEHALVLGLIFGLFFAFFKSKKANWTADKLNLAITYFLEKMFIPLLPFFAAGFILKMQHDGILDDILISYLPIIFIIFISSVVYLILFYGVAAGFRLNPWFTYLKNAIPAGIMGFSTMSSLATLPITLKAAEKNTDNPGLSRAVIPATVNIHMIGDSIAIPIFAIAILLSFGGLAPSFKEYLTFAQFFVLYKFAVAAVPGGSVIIMMPILKQQLGLSDEMAALMTTIYILFDPLVTAVNVLGNSAFVIIMSKIFKKNPEQSTLS